MAVTDIENIVVWLNAQPPIAEQKVKCGEVIVALGEHVALGQFKLIACHRSEELSQEVDEVVMREDYCASARVKNGVNGPVGDGLVLICYRAPFPAILDLTDREPGALGRPEEVIEHIDMLDPALVLHSLLFGLAKVNEGLLAKRR